jgi:hypothetical protein
MSLQTKQIEELFLKLFKVTVLIAMGLCLLAVIGLAINVAYQSTKRPVEPEPAQKAPQKDVSLDELKKLLEKQAQPKEAVESPTRPKPMAPSLRYLEEVTRLYRCSLEFGKNIGAEIEEQDNARAAENLENLRAQIENFATDPRRGERWVKSVTDFTCTALADPAIIAMRKEKKISSVFYPILNFHKDTWDAIQNEIAAFEQAERNRIDAERQAEQERIAQARADAINSAIAAGIAFGTFMLLAIYLLLAKVETNMREINQSIRSARQP